MGYRKEENKKKSTLDGKNIHARKETWKRTETLEGRTGHQHLTDG